MKSQKKGGGGEDQKKVGTDSKSMRTDSRNHEGVTATLFQVQVVRRGAPDGAYSARSAQERCGE